MIDELARWLAKHQTQRPKAFIFGFLLVTLALLPGIFLLLGNVEPSLEKVLPASVEELDTMNDMRSRFGADMMYLLVTAEGPVQDVRHPAVRSYLSSLTQKIEAREHVLQTTSIAAQEIPDSLRATKGTADSDVAKRMTVVEIRADTGADAETIEQVVLGIRDDIRSLESANPGVSIALTGANVIDYATFNVIIKDFARITLLSFLLVAAVVFITFRSLRALMPLAVVTVALLWTLGIAGYLGLTITVVSMVAAAMILGLGIDFGIHITHTFTNERKKRSRKGALQSTMEELLRATIGASLTTTAGFLALLFGVMTAMQTLGILLAIGIISTLLGASLLLPPLLYETG